MSPRTAFRIVSARPFWTATVFAIASVVVLAAWVATVDAEPSAQPNVAPTGSDNVTPADDGDGRDGGADATPAGGASISPALDPQSNTSPLPERFELASL